MAIFFMVNIHNIMGGTRKRRVAKAYAEVEPPHGPLFSMTSFGTLLFRPSYLPSISFCHYVTWEMDIEDQLLMKRFSTEYEVYRRREDYSQRCSREELKYAVFTYRVAIKVMSDNAKPGMGWLPNYPNPKLQTEIHSWPNKWR